MREPTINPTPVEQPTMAEILQAAAAAADAVETAYRAIMYAQLTAARAAADCPRAAVIAWDAAHAAVDIVDICRTMCIMRDAAAAAVHDALYVDKE